MWHDNVLLKQGNPANDWCSEWKEGWIEKTGVWEPSNIYSLQLELFMCQTYKES